MKKAMNKVLAMVIALVLIATMSAAIAEEIEAAPAPVQEVIEVVEVVEAPKTEVVEEVATEEATEEAIEEVATEEIVEEEVTTEEIATEAVVEEVVIEEVAEEEIPEDAQLVSVIEETVERSVCIYASYAGNTVSYGDTIKLYAVLKGYENVNYEMQWQVSSDNSSWQNISGANGSSYSLTVTEDNADNYYRIAVTVAE